MTLQPVEGGYVLNGVAGYGSGCQHADWLGAGGQVLSEGDAEPPFRMAMFPADQVEILDTWDTTGLRGTGSHDYALHDLFVPAHLTASPTEALGFGAPSLVYRQAFVSTQPATAIGIAKRGLAEFKTIVTAKTRPRQTSALAEDPLIAVTLAKAEALVYGGRAFLLHTCAALDRLRGTGEQPNDELRSHAKLAVVRAVQDAAAAVDMLCEVLGGTAAYRKNLIERLRRDMHTALAHTGSSTMQYLPAGRLLLGLDPQSRFI